MMESGIMNNMPMPLSFPLVFCQCVIFLASFEGIVCRGSEFALENFSTANMYRKVEVVGSNQTQRFIFKKVNNTIGDRQRSVLFSDIIHHTLAHEASNRKVASFYVRGECHANYNIKFQSESQARYFVKNKALPEIYIIRWARMYANWQTATITYEYLDDDDIGFKLLNHGHYPNPMTYLYERSYFFRRSDIENIIRKSPPCSLYLRSRKRKEDYEIVFGSTEDLDSFLELLPETECDDDKTVGYYFMVG